MEGTSVASIDPRAMTVFEAEMKRRNIDLGFFNLEFYDQGVDYLIVLESKTRKLEQRGSDPEHPEVEALVSKVSFRIKRVTYVK